MHVAKRARFYITAIFGRFLELGGFWAKGPHGANSKLYIGFDPGQKHAKNRIYIIGQLGAGNVHLAFTGHTTILSLGRWPITIQYTYMDF